MRASKEQAEKAIRTVKRLREDKRVEQRHLSQLESFVEAAKRKLPTEAAYERDAERSRKKVFLRHLEKRTGTVFVPTVVA